MEDIISQINNFVNQDKNRGSLLFIKDSKTDKCKIDINNLSIAEIYAMMKVLVNKINKNKKYIELKINYNIK